MIKYLFFDTDISGKEERDISGKDYENLIQTCCQYCSFFSLIVTNKDCSLLKELATHEIPKSEKISFQFNHYGDDLEIKYYRVSQQLCETILANTNTLFSWINGWNFANPEDPTFYRKDGSVFFTSTIHEGECSLMVKEDEDVSKITNDFRWVSKGTQGTVL